MRATGDAGGRAVFVPILLKPRVSALLRPTRRSVRPHCRIRHPLGSGASVKQENPAILATLLDAGSPAASFPAPGPEREKRIAAAAEKNRESTEVVPPSAIVPPPG